MNKEITERLVKYRKNKGLSQEQLAFELGVSRQAVSKWERGESSPDTDNLIALAKLYNVSLDDLLYKDPVYNKNEEHEKQESNEKDKNFDFDLDMDCEKFNWKEGLRNLFDSDLNIDVKSGDEYAYVGKEGIYCKDKKGDEVKISFNGKNFNVFNENDLPNHNSSISYSTHKKILGILSGALLIVVTIIYLTLGFLLKNNEGWSIYWTLYFLPFIIESIYECIYHQRFNRFNSVFAALFAYLFAGMYLNLWHPTWIIFLFIPVYHIIASFIDYLIMKRKKKKKIIDVKVEEHNIEE